MTAQTLMPPVVDTFQTAFVYNEDAYVYFSPSRFNSISSSDNWKIHVSLKKQTNNKEALKTNIAPSGIVVLNYEEGSLYCGQEDNKYYVRIPTTFLTEEEFDTECFYKIQLRYDVNDKSKINWFSDTTTQYERMSYLNNTENQKNFSEWSTITLIRPIPKPIITIDQFLDRGPQFSWGNLQITGKVQFYKLDSSDSWTLYTSNNAEKLRSFYFEIRNLETENTIYTSNIFYTSSQFDCNEINGNIDLASIIDEDSTDKYSFIIYYTTTNLYEDNCSNYFYLTSKLVETEFNKINFTLTANADKGNIEIDITPQKEEYLGLLGIIIVKRTSSQSNFQTWDKLQEIIIPNGTEWNLQLEDSTVKSLEWYEYSFQYISPSGVSYQTRVIGEWSETQQKYLPIFVDFDNDFLLDQEKQLSFCNFKIGTYKPIKSITKVDGLSNVYPTFVANASMNYRQLNISGMITVETDVFRKFFNEENEIRYTEGYQQYQEERGIWNLIANNVTTNGLSVAHGDTLLERMFREEVVQWLSNNKPKLLKTPTEGNILVLLTDVSLTPEEQLNRLIYNFSGTCYEIGDAQDIAELEEQNIIQINHYTDDLDANNFLTSQISKPQYRSIHDLETITSTSLDDDIQTYFSLYATVEPELQKQIKGLQNKYFYTNIFFNNIKIFSDFYDITYVWLVNAHSKDYVKYYLSPHIESSFRKKQSDCKPFSVSEIPSDIEIADILIPYNSSSIGEIQYIVNAAEGYDINDTTDITYTTKDIVGQIKRYFSYEDTIKKYIDDKHLYLIIEDKYTFTQTAGDIKSVWFEGEPNTIIEILYTDENAYVSYSLDADGVLKIKNINDDHNIKDIKICGQWFNIIEDEVLTFIRDGEAVNLDELKSETTQPQSRHIYKSVSTIDNNTTTTYELYLRGQYININKETGIANVPVYLTINYIVDVNRVVSYNDV